jgi:hypothetical protein
MFGLLGNLVKATVGVVIETPLAIVSDVCDTMTDGPQDVTHTEKALTKVVGNLQNACDPEEWRCA